MEGALGVSRWGDEQMLVRHVDPGEEVLRSLPVHLVGVGAFERPGHEGDRDLLQELLGLLDGARALKGEEQGIEHARIALPSQSEDVVQVHVHHVVRVPHGRLPRFFERRRQLRRHADARAQAVVETDVVGHGLDDPARMLIAEAFKPPVAPAGIQGEDGLESRVPLGRRAPLLGREGREAHHADVAVAPGLLDDPLDRVVVVPLVARVELALALVATPHLPDHVDVAVGDEPLRISPLDDPVPLRRPGRLPDPEVLGHLDPLQILVVHGARVENGERAGRIGPIDVDAERDTVAHRHRQVVVLDHRVVGDAVFVHGCLPDRVRRTCRRIPGRRAAAAT